MDTRLPDPRRPLAAVAPLAGTPVRLFLTSATLLFVELLLIRWIPANVKYVGFFSNFLLMASFLGHRPRDPARAARPSARACRRSRRSCS